MQVEWRDYIVSDPTVLRGKPHIVGTRIPVGLILGHLAADQTIEQILQEYEGLTRAHVSACLDYARELSEFEGAAAVADAPLGPVGVEEGGGQGGLGGCGVGVGGDQPPGFLVEGKHVRAVRRGGLVDVRGFDDDAPSLGFAVCDKHRMLPRP